jgi:hypothetical protein
MLLSILFLVIAFFAGLYIGGQNNPPSSVNPPVAANTQASDQKAAVQKGSYEDGYQAALDFARKKLSDRGMLGLSSKAGRNMLYDVPVKSVNGNQITVEFDSSKLDILSEGTVTKTITVPDTVKIEKRTPKDPAEVQKAFDEFRVKQEAFRKSMDAGSQIKDFPQPPATYTSENVNLPDLKAGDILNIAYEADAAKPDTLNAVSVELVNDPLLIQKIKGDNAPSDVPVPAPVTENTVKNPPADITPPPASETEAPSADKTAATAPAESAPQVAPPAEVPVTPPVK